MLALPTPPRKILITLLLVVPVTANASHDLSASVFFLLPPHCQAWYAEMQQMGRTEGFVVPSPKRYRWKYWHKRLGQASIPFNHYCPALGRLIEASGPLPMGQGSHKKRESLLQQAEGGVRYEIGKGLSSPTWTDDNKFVLAEAYSKLGDIAQMRGDPASSTQHYRNAIKTLPTYTPAYIGLAKSFETLGLYDEAIAILKKAARHRPKSRVIADTLARLQSEKGKSAGSQSPK